MRKNRLKEIWNNGDVAVNGWIQIRDSYVTEIMAHQGWDSLTLDLQHGYTDIDAAIPLLQAISTTDVVPLIRVPELNPAKIMLALDAGVYGIICPMINNREETEEFIRACRFPPEGNRSVGALRALLYGGGDYMTCANDTVLAIAMIETVEAVKNLEEILTTPGLDAIYIGPSDLSIAYGHTPAPDIEDGPMRELIDNILKMAKCHNIPAGLHNFEPEYAAQVAKQGFQFVTVGSDARFVALGARAAVEHVRNELSEVSSAR